MGTVQEKCALRDKFRRIRREIPQEKRGILAEAAAKHVFELDFYQKSDKILIYVSYRDELSTFPVIRRALLDGKRLFLPRCDPSRRGHMAFYRVCDPAHDLLPGLYGISEPSEDCEPLTEEGGLCIVPGLAFSGDGYRIGYGGGYYDRFLSTFSGTALGYCFTQQIVDSIPREETDKPVHGVATPDGLILPD